MSKKEGFTGDGFDSFPSLYHDEQRVHNVEQWPDSMLIDRIVEYSQFLRRPDTMPRARDTASRILGRMQFEADSRPDLTHLSGRDLNQFRKGK